MRSLCVFGRPYRCASLQPFWKLLTRDVRSYWKADCTTDFLGDTSPPPTFFPSSFGLLADGCQIKAGSHFSVLASLDWQLSKMAGKQIAQAVLKRPVFITTNKGRGVEEIAFRCGRVVVWRNHRKVPGAHIADRRTFGKKHQFFRFGHFRPFLDQCCRAQWILLVTNQRIKATYLL